MKNTYPKKEKLKSQKLINLLFAEGKSVSKFPLRLVYACVEDLEDSSLKMGVTVSKKHFKKAVDRNYYKRILRETYRNNKNILINGTNNKKYICMLMYQTKDTLSFHEINEKTIALFEKFIKAINETN